MDWSKVDNIYMGTTPTRRAYVGNERVWPINEDPCLEFRSPSSFTIQVSNTTKNWDGTIQYSADKSTWNIWDGTTTLTSVASNNMYRLYIRGSGNTIVGGNANTYRWIITGTDVTITGDIRTLLDFQDPVNTTMANYCFSYLFYQNNSIITCPDFPAMTLSDYCYQYCFSWGNWWE